MRPVRDGVRVGVRVRVRAGVRVGIRVRGKSQCWGGVNPSPLIRGRRRQALATPPWPGSGVVQWLHT